jgi:polar amino acid transport system ATP-binding protein
MSEPILRIEKLHKSFGANHVLRGVDLEVHPGEVIVIIGPSGCGKSTLLRCVNHLEEPTSGGVTFGGEYVGEKRINDKCVPRPERELNAIRGRIGMVFQRFNLFPTMTALGNVIEAPVHVKGLPRAEAEKMGCALLERVGLLDKKDEYPNRLSGGQQQRVAIARALAMQPELMLFDEATSSLDPELIGEVLAVMQGLARDGMTMMVVTHEMQFAREVGTRILFMDSGRVLEDAAPTTFFAHPEHPRAREFLRRIHMPVAAA